MNDSTAAATLERPSALAKVRSLREQADKLAAEAKEDALAAAEKAVSVLNELGLTYRLVEGHENHRVSNGRAVRRQKRDVPCPVCHFKTEPPHDGRFHRAQSTKKPFTDAELNERHLSKVE